MKIAVYTICKNESKFVNRFMDSVKEADVVIVADTGSTDDTVELLKNRGAIVHNIVVDPWRFDVARNISLSLVPSDIDVCVCIDLDEVLTEGWREEIEKSWTDKTTRLRYEYIWSVLPDGSKGVTFWYDKIHSRNGYRWVKPVHEILVPSIDEVQTYSYGFSLYHFPDSTKSRGSYLPLLELGCKENPEDDRNCHYLGREYMYYKMYDKAINELKRHLSLPLATWKSERSASMRYISKCYFQLGDKDSSLEWALKSCAECPNEREPWVNLANIYYSLSNYLGVVYAISNAVSIKDRTMSYICEPESWSSYPYDIGSISAYRCNLKHLGLEWAKEALILSPNDERIAKNIKIFEGEIQ